MPDTDPAAPWRLAGEHFAAPKRFHITTATLEHVQHAHRNAGAITVGDSLTIQAL